MRALHVVPELRAAHVERFTEWATQDAVLYRATKWDLDAVPPSERVTRLTPRTFFNALRQEGKLTVELPEPLWMRELPLTAVLAIAARVIKGRRVHLVTYCIENNDVPTLVGAPKWTEAPVGRVVGTIIGGLFGTLLDKVAFGSPGAMATYASLPGLLRAPHELILELPAPTLPITEATNSDVLFVGRLEDRKGVGHLLDAWRRIEPETSASISVVGDGPLHSAVAAWVEESPKRRSHMKHIEHASLGVIYARHRVLVAPSVRDGRWREQIGLPIKEALSHGLTIVTTSETGLASWLSTENHTVISDVDQLARALLTTIHAPLRPDVVVASLPTIDGRRNADLWMKS